MKHIVCLLFYIIISTSYIIAGNENTHLSVNGNPPFRVPKVNSHIEVDAYLNESFWKEAVKVDANIEVGPGENIPAPVKTEALIAYDDGRIFVAIIAYDDKPDEIRAHLVDRDNIWDDDWVLILFDTFNDQRRTYDFGCNPFGIQADMIETPTGGGGSWDAIWESSGRITDEGYIVEMCIPFNSLNFPRVEGDQIWGFDVVRSYPRSVRHHIGAFPRDRDNNCYMCQSEKMIGFAEVAPGKNIEFDPTFSSVYTQERENETSGSFKETDRVNDFGLTGHWGITPNMTLSGTLNPDFSNIEADETQLDINNPFSNFYSEKRPFFLEGADFFQTPLHLLHTRTMADPILGAKITGKEGPNAVGFYTVQDEITNFIFPGSESSDKESLNKKSFGTVLRYKRDILKSSNIGIIATDREGENYHNRVAGIDGDFKFTPKDRVRFQVLNANTEYPDSIIANYDQPEGDFGGTAYRGHYSRSTKNYELSAKHELVDKNFRADLGFMDQVGYKYSELAATYIKRHAPGHWFTWLSLYNSFDYKRDINGNLLHRAFTQRVNYDGPMNSHAHIYYEIGKDRYDGQEFRKNWMQGCFGLRPVPRLFVHLYWRYGDNIDYSNTQEATSYQIGPSFDLNLGMHFKIEGSHTLEQLHVDDGPLYTANVSRLKLIYQFNKQIFVRANFQYKDYDRDIDLYEDDDIEAKEQNLYTQFLLSYKINPKTVFFLGYSDDHYGDRDIDLTKTNRTVFAKLGYAFRL